MSHNITNIPAQVMILDCVANPCSSLAQGAEGSKAICSALKDISWFTDFEFSPANKVYGTVRMQVTSADINPVYCAVYCRFTVEIEYTGYDREELLKIIRKHTYSDLSVRAEEVCVTSPI